MNRLFRARHAVCLAANLLFAAGCGLSDYQEKLARQQDRVKYWDRENELLGKPLELPKKKEGDPSLPVFFRPPLGIPTTPDEKPTGVLFHYGRAGKSAKGSKLSGVQDLYFAVTINKDWSDFKNEVFASIKGSEGKATQRRTLPAAPDREPMTLETASFIEADDPPMSNQCYFFRDEIYRIAIVFRGTERAMNSEPTKETIELSLKSLAVGDVAKR